MSNKGRVSALLIFSSLFLAGGISQVMAVPIQLILVNDKAQCDPLVVPLQVDELGIAPPFPAGEVLRVADAGTSEPPCPSNKFNNDPDVVVSITNANSIPFTDVWYVVDVTVASISNSDGEITGNNNNINPAFKIDADYCAGGGGINLPLISESMNLDCIFEPGEVWNFVIQDYFSGAGVSHTAINSIGLDSAGPSSGSIIAIPGGMAVGGEFIGIDSTMVLAAGAQYTAAWMIPVIVSAIGIGIVIARKF